MFLPNACFTQIVYSASIYCMPSLLSILLWAKNLVLSKSGNIYKLMGSPYKWIINYQVVKFYRENKLYIFNFCKSWYWTFLFIRNFINLYKVKDTYVKGFWLWFWWGIVLFWHPSFSHSLFLEFIIGKTFVSLNELHWNKKCGLFFWIWLPGNQEPVQYSNAVANSPGVLLQLPFFLSFVCVHLCEPEARGQRIT